MVFVFLIRPEEWALRREQPQRGDMVTELQPSWLPGEEPHTQPALWQVA